MTCFGVDGAGKLSDDRYFIFYNQTSSPEGAVSMHQSGESTVFSVDLNRLPGFLQRLVVTVAAESGTMQALARGLLTLEGELDRAAYVFTGAGYQQEKALILCEVYRKDGIWRFSVVDSGFNGGLSALLAHFGGEEVKPDPPTPAPAPPEPKVNLSKISLKKSGESHKIDLTKNRRRIHVNLNWDQRRGLFSRGIDLDLACMYRLKDGRQGVIQALGNSFGAADQPPYIKLDKDDRSGASANGENMDFFRPELIDFAVVFAFIYEGVPNWRSTNARVVLSQQGAPDIEVQIDNPNSNERFCVLGQPHRPGRRAGGPAGGLVFQQPPGCGRPLPLRLPLGGGPQITRERSRSHVGFAAGTEDLHSNRLPDLDPGGGAAASGAPGGRRVLLWPGQRRPPLRRAVFSFL